MNCAFDHDFPQLFCNFLLHRAKKRLAKQEEAKLTKAKAVKKKKIIAKAEESEEEEESSAEEYESDLGESGKLEIIQI